MENKQFKPNLWFAVFILLILPLIAQAEIIIESAKYGAKGEHCNAAHRLSQKCNGNNYCSVKVNNSLCGDPNPNVKKHLRVYYSCSYGDEHQLKLREGERLRIRCDRSKQANNSNNGYYSGSRYNDKDRYYGNGYNNSDTKYDGYGGRYNNGRYNDGGYADGYNRPKRYKRITIERAKYGSKGKTCNASSRVKNQCNNKKNCTVKASNQLCGDPHRNSVKHLKIIYRCGSKKFSTRAKENNLAYLNCGKKKHSKW